ncbi:MAG: group III truncated hemoglobin [Gammaproteobacteria bacterium]|nr:group III truncated hemoglobin [Gammaproteobacteria bacterium]
MDKCDVGSINDVRSIVERFYAQVLDDQIIGYIFTDVVQIDLETHLPLIIDFWSDALFGGDRYQGNTLAKHLEVHAKVALKPGHFTRWLYLFNKAVDAEHEGDNAQRMKQRAEQVAKSISAALTDQKRSAMTLTLEASKKT